MTLKTDAEIYFYLRLLQSTYLSLYILEDNSKIYIQKIWVLYSIISKIDCMFTFQTTGSKNSGEWSTDQAIMRKHIYILGLILVLFGTWMPVLHALR